MTTRKNHSYKKIEKYIGIYQNTSTANFQARKKIGTTLQRKTFKSLRDALKWMRLHNGQPSITSQKKEQTKQLKDVWDLMQEKHFPTLAQATIDVWLRRYELLKRIQHYNMSELKPSVVSDWIHNCITYFKSDNYNLQGRGNARRCNLKSELNLLKTIFNWYINSEYFEEESHLVTLPVKPYHYKKSILREVPYKERAIKLDDTFSFFEQLKQPFKDLAMLQFFTASRIGEVAGLQWNRIDFKRKQVLIKETCYWDQSNKVFVKLNPYPKNKKARVVYLTNEIFEILLRRKADRVKENDFVFNFLNKPLNYCTIQTNYRSAQKKSGMTVTGTHNLRHGMATLARQVGGGLDAVIAMTGHKDLKLADHYSKIDDDKQRTVSLKIMGHIHKVKLEREC